MAAIFSFQNYAMKIFWGVYGFKTNEENCQITLSVIQQTEWKNHGNLVISWRTFVKEYYLT